MLHGINLSAVINFTRSTIIFLFKQLYDLSVNKNHKMRDHQIAEDLRTAHEVLKGELEKFNNDKKVLQYNNRIKIISGCD